MTNAVETIDSENLQLVDRWREGDHDAATVLFERYLEKLLRLAKRQLSARLQSRVDENDVVQTVFRTFFRRAQQAEEAGSFHFESDDDLWRLLVTITLCKTRKVAARHLAHKRDARRESSLTGQEHTPELARLLLRPPNHEDAVIFSDQLEALSLMLNPRQVDILQLRLEGFEHVEIAEKLDISERTVGRAMSQVRQRLEWIAKQSFKGE
ncbi:MAG: sigma-70 family RNA polymerase sigma factor [Planctomycetaceae bacterium]|nr:sigma-70 family RNA polymerase sigma factor [Planctomycetaceae bacterium]